MAYRLINYKNGYKIAAKIKRLRADEGSATLESALIVPVAFLVVCLSIYAALALFEHAQLRASADYAAHRVASVWRGSAAAYGEYESEGEISLYNESNPAGRPADGVGLYHRTFDAHVAEKRKTAAASAEFYFDGAGLPGYTQAEGNAKFNGGLFGKSLSAALSGLTTVPYKKAMTTFGQDNRFASKFTAESIIADYAENIRRADYVIEIEKKLEESSPEIAGAIASFSDLLERVREYIGSLL